MTKTPITSFYRKGAPLVALALALSASGCTTERQIRGYLPDKAVLEAITPGIDNRNSVKGLLGNPSVEATFGDGVWYYISSFNVRKSFMLEKSTSRDIMAVHFGDRGIVSEVKRYTLADGRDINPVDDKTPTRGKQLGFFEQIFGNIGRFAGAPGGGGPGGPR
jgi:outer membrane protein assembly factor BamE (lipoprotein component of BamABCDE complex)